MPDASPLEPADIPGLTYVGRFEGHEAAIEAAKGRTFTVRAVPESWLDEVDLYVIEGVPDDAA